MRFNRVAAFCFFLLAFLGNAPKSISQVCNLSQIPSNLRNGLVAYYPFCGNANDVSGNNINGTVFNASTTTDRFSGNTAYAFDGSSSYIRANNSALINFGTGSFTLSSWVLSTSGNRWQHFITHIEPTANPYTSKGYALRYDNSQPSYLQGNTFTNTGFGAQAPAVNATNWHHIVSVYNVSTLTVSIYVDGILAGTESIPAPLQNVDNNGFLYFGVEDPVIPLPSGPQYLTGKLDDIAIWNRALTSCEIIQLYNASSNSIPNLGGFTYNQFQDTTRVCGTTTTLNAGSGYSSYSWNTGATTQSINPTVSGFYKVTVTNSAGCTASDSTYLSLVKASIINNDTTICLGNSIRLSIDSLFPNRTACTSGQLPESMRNGLLAYYPFCGNANNAMGTGNNGTVYNATLTTDRFGNSNSAYNFNGTNAYIDFGSNTSIGPTSTIPISISLWVSAGASGMVISKYTNLDATNSFFYFSRSANGYQWVGNGTNPYINASGVSDNSWAHYVLVGVAGSNNSKVYRNGVLVATGTLAMNATMRAVNLLVGRVGASFPGYLNGKVDDIFIYNRALSASEVQNLYLYQPTVSWSTGATTNSIVVSPTQTTTYYVDVSDGVGTCRDSVTVTVSDLTSYNPLSDTTRICGTTTTLNASSGFATYSWSTGATTQSISPTTSGFYKVTVTNANGCTARDSTYLSLVKANIINNDTTICLGNSIRLSIDTLFPNQAACSVGQLPNSMRNGLSAFYPFCGNSNDQAGIINGQVINSVLVADKYGNSNQAYQLNGSSSTINYTLPFLGGGQKDKFTFITRIKLNSLSNSPNIWGKSLFWGEVNFQVNSNGSIQFWWANSITGNKYSSIYTAPGLIEIGRWYDIAVVFQNAVGVIYVNGVPVTTFLNWTAQGGATLSTSRIESTCNFTQDANSSMIGVRISGSGREGYLSGVVDELLIYDRALSSPEIQLFTSSNTSIFWSTGATTNSILVSPTQTTTYYVTVSDGVTTCTDSVRVIVSDIGTFNPLSDTTRVCGTTTTLNASSGFASYSWNTGATTQSITPTTSGLYRVTVTNSAGCTASDSTYLSLVNANILNNDTTICRGTSVLLTAVGSGGLNSIFSGPQPTDSLIISRYLAYTGPSQFSTPNLPPGYYYLKASGTFSFGSLWLPNGYDAAYNFEGASPSPTVTPSFTWNEYCPQGNNNCQNRRPTPDIYNSSHIYYYPFSTNGGIQTIYGAADECCWGDNRDGLTFSFYKRLGGVLTYSWSTGATTNQITVTPTQTTTYYVTVSDGVTTCTDSVRVTVSDIGTFNPLSDTTRVCGTSTVLNAGSGYSTYSWSNGSTSQANTLTTGGFYRVTVSNANGCTATDSTLLSLVNARIINNDTTICRSAPITLGVDSTNTSNNIQSYLATFSNRWTHDFITEVGRVYRLRVSGTWRIGGSPNQFYDAAYFINSQSPLPPFSCSSILTQSAGIWYRNLCGFRPNPDVYNPSHQYDFYFTASDQITRIGFDDTNNYGDNSGSLLYELSPFAAINSVTWSTGATTNQITVNPTQTTTYYATVTDGITTCTDSVRITVATVDTAVVVLDLLQVCTNGGQVRMQAGVASGYQWLRNGVAIAGATSRLYTATQTGAYRVALLNSAGCRDTSRTINVSLYPQPVSGFNINPNTQCFAGNQFSFTNTTILSSGTITYLWNFGNGITSTQSNPSYSYPATGTYIVKLVATSGTGCKDSTTRTITVNPSPTATFSVNTASQCVTGNQFSFTNNSSITTGTLTYAWTFGDGNVSTNANPSHSYINAGSYTVKLVVTSALGCKDSTTRSVNVYAKPTVDFSVNRLAQCVNENSFVFTNNTTITSGTITYIWRFGDGNGATTTNATHSYLTAGTYIVKLIAVSNNGCSDSTTQTVTVNPKPTVDFSINIAAQCLSTNQFVFNNLSTITSGVLTHAWNFGNGATSIQTSPTYTYGASGVYAVKLVTTSAVGCRDSITRSVTVHAMPTGTLNTPTTNLLCEGGTVSLSASGGTSYQWFINGGAIVGATSATYAANQPGTYTVNVISSNGCVAAATGAVTLQLVRKPTVNFTYDKYCAGFPTQFTDQSNTANSNIVTYSWIFGQGQGTSTQQNPVYTFPTANTYSVSLTVTPVACPSLATSITKPVSTVAPPANQRYISLNAVENRDLQLEARVFGGATYSWAPSSGLSSSTISNPIFNYNAQVDYVITITTGIGCIIKDTQLVRIFKEKEIYVPKGFSPNGDGNNDKIFPRLVGVRSLNYFKVFNRWGQLIFMSTNINEGWDGTYKGVKQPMEGYVWIAEGVDIDNNIIKRTGTFLLLR